MNKMNIINNHNPGSTPDDKNFLEYHGYSYRVVCKHCHKTIFFSGHSDEITYITCDQCAHLQ